MKNFLIHIPHSSQELPDIFWENVIIKKEKLLKENKLLCDEKVDEFVPLDITNVVKFPYSRMFCDVERFRNDEDEIMSKLGMGAIYTMTSDKTIFSKYNESYKEKVLTEYYDKHHKELYELCKQIIEMYKKCYIIDLHSFSDEMVLKMLGKTNNPDICIGVDLEFQDENFTEFTINHFNHYGYTVMINHPYSGTIVPTPYYVAKDQRVKSLMIEINKRIYLNNQRQFDEFNNCMNDYFTKILKLK